MEFDPFGVSTQPSQFTIAQEELFGIRRTRKGSAIPRIIKVLQEVCDGILAQPQVVVVKARTGHQMIPKVVIVL